MHQSVNDRTVGSLIGAFPDARGHFGPYGGRFVAETLMQPLKEEPPVRGIAALGGGVIFALALLAMPIHRHDDHGHGHHHLHGHDHSRADPSGIHGPP